MNISIVEDDPIFLEAIKNYAECKAEQKRLQTVIDESLKVFEEYAEVDKDSDFEGKVTLQCGTHRVVLDFKFNRTVDTDALKALCLKYGKPANVFTNVKYEYPGVTMLKAMDPTYTDEVDKCFKKKRGKTAVEIKSY